MYTGHGSSGSAAACDFDPNPKNAAILDLTEVDERTLGSATSKNGLFLRPASKSRKLDSRFWVLVGVLSRRRRVKTRRVPRTMAVSRKSRMSATNVTGVSVAHGDVGSGEVRTVSGDGGAAGDMVKDSGEVMNDWIRKERVEWNERGRSTRSDEKEGRDVVLMCVHQNRG